MLTDSGWITNCDHRFSYSSYNQHYILWFYLNSFIVHSTFHLYHISSTFTLWSNVGSAFTVVYFLKPSLVTITLALEDVEVDCKNFLWLGFSHGGNPSWLLGGDPYWDRECFLTNLWHYWTIKVECHFRHQVVRTHFCIFLGM